jgi:hypothetical protein
MSNQPEFGKIAEDYAGKAGKQIGGEGFAGNYQYNESYLWKNLLKNARALQKHPTLYATIGHSFDGEDHHFTNSPQFSDQFNKALTTLKSLYEVVLPKDSGCLALKKNYTDDETYTHYIKRRLPSNGIEDLNSTEVRPNNIIQCPERHCANCESCRDHHQEYKKALGNVLSSDDTLRHLGIKNLITTMNSWAAHLDTRGNNEATMGDRDYEDDAYGHNLLSTTLRSTADKFVRAGQADYFNTDGKGGTIHRDYLGSAYGNKGMDTR